MRFLWIFMQHHDKIEPLCRKRGIALKKITSPRSAALLVLTALIWGFGFVAQSAGLAHVGPLTLNGVRFLVASVVLAALVPLLDKIRGLAPSVWGTQDVAARKQLLIGGVACGVALLAASTLQQYGIVYTSVGKSGFLTALYILLVPLLGMLRGKRPPAKVWAGVALALVGMYLLCINEGFSVNIGDVLTIGCALMFSLHILIIDHFAARVDGVRLSCIQFLVCGLLGCVPMLLLEQPHAADLLGAWLPIFYAGAISAAMGYTLQILGQKGTDPTLASLILSLESVFAALGGWLVLGQTLAPRELLGCALVFAAILLAQLPAVHRQKNKSAS